MSKSDSSQNYQIPHQQSATSLQKQCLDNLRFPNSAKYKGKQSKPKTHLLACISEFIHEQSQFKLEQIDDFCCFDRMKRLIQKNKQNQHDSSQNDKLEKFVQVQAKMRKMQQNLMKYSTDLIKRDSKNKDSKKMGNQFDGSMSSNLLLGSPVERKWKDNILTQNNKARDKNQNLPGRFQMKKKIREQGYKQYLEWQKKKLVDSQNSVKQFVEAQIQLKVQNMLQQRDIKFNELLKQNKNLQRSILQRTLQIQNLKTKQIYLTKNVSQLQTFKNLITQQNTAKNKQRLNFLQDFHKKFLQTFPNETIISLKQFIETLIDKCLHKFQDVECKKKDQWNQEKLDYKQKINKLEGTLQKFKINQNQLLSNIKQFRYQQSVASLQMDCLVKKQIQLQKLQKKILSLYNDWYGKLSQSQKQLMKNLGYLQSSYQYQQMLEYIVVFKNKFSTDTKVNDYLIKVLRGIHRIRKILFPRTISNTGDKKQIMDPLYILQKLQKYIKSKVYQIQKKSSSIQKGTRFSHIIQQEFLGVQEPEDELQLNNGLPVHIKSEQIKKHLSLNLNNKPAPKKKN